jgi:superfamily I DNA/RNA helicase
MVQLLGVDLTEEQKAILDTCQTPDHRTESGKGQLVRVTAAAGTGKTTTLLALALQGAQKGHAHITYLSFTNVSASDGRQRLQEALEKEGILNVVVDARTLHSCAQRALMQRIGDSLPYGVRKPMLEERDVKAWISEQSKAKIDDFLQDCFLEIDCRRSDLSKKEEDKERAREQVEFFLFKTLQQFCKQDATRERFGTGLNNRTRDYYPAKLFHKETQFGFDKAIYNNKVCFYADQACLLWDCVVQDNVQSHDFIMKRAQLMGLRIPGTLLLVDESQDMDGCQVDWAAKQQVVFGTQVYVVGDAAQTIYSFRGAKSQSLMGLNVDKDCMLTASWRFGNAIACTANSVLFSKHYSAQTEYRDGRYKSWRPYRVRVGAPREDRITRHSLLPQWRELEQLTLIARTNVALMFEILGLFGPLTGVDSEPKSLSPAKAKDGPENDKNDGKYGSWSDVDVESADDDGTLTAGEEPAEACTLHFPQEFPKIHINGGSSSGIHKWKEVMNQVEMVYGLYQSGGAGMSLPRNLFPEFKGRRLTWGSFQEECTRRELTSYGPTIGFVEQYKARTLQAMEAFRTHVIERRFTTKEADIILTTCHAAKGMEWDNVQLCEDFIDMCNYKQDHSIMFSEKRPRSPPWQFGFPNWGDDVNLLYVACTRAKRQLSIPSSSILNVWKDFDSLHQWYLGRDINGSISLDDFELEGVEGSLGEESVLALYESLVGPLRTEYSLEPQQLLVETLIDLEGEPDEGGESDGKPAMTAGKYPNPGAGFVTPDENGIKREPDNYHKKNKREPDT